MTTHITKTPPPPTTYLVISFDFMASSDVKIHYLGEDEKNANYCFDIVEGETEHFDYNGQDIHRLVELIEIERNEDKEFINAKGMTCFWGGSKGDGCRISRSNNN
jgi:hypothetical protein